jgi:hypothetical protein
MFRRFVVATALAAVASAAVPANQIVALNELYSNTSGKWWGKSASWGVGDPCTNVWSGILCTAGFVYVACSALAVTTLMTVVVARVCCYMSLSFCPPTTRVRCCPAVLAWRCRTTTGVDRRPQSRLAR